jgi:hypothetical protein
MRGIAAGRQPVDISPAWIRRYPQVGLSLAYQAANGPGRPRPSRTVVRKSPPASDQPRMPAQHGPRRDDQRQPPSLRQDSNQRADDRPIRPGQAGPLAGALQHRDLVAQHQDLRVLGRIRARQQHQPTQQPNEDQVQQTNRHKPRSSPTGMATEGRSRKPRRSVRPSPHVCVDLSADYPDGRPASQLQHARSGC